MAIYKLRTILMGVAVATLVLSCVSSKTPVRVFVVEGGQQYFVRPTQIKSDATRLEIDFTIRKTNSDRLVRANMSIGSLQTVGWVSLEMETSGTYRQTTVKIRDPEVIFSTAETQRISGSCQYDEFARFLEALRYRDSDILLTIHYKNGDTENFNKTKRLRGRLAAIPPL